MKKKKVELAVDYIGGEEPLTLAEEIAISAYFKSRKATSIKSTVAIKRKAFVGKKKKL